MEKHIRAMKTPLFLVIIFLVCLFLIESPGGDLIGWMNNETCYRLLGCNSGFFGFDFIVHLTSGAVLMCLLIWLMRNYPTFNVIRGGFKVKFLILIALVALTGVIWEFGEFSHDHWRMAAYRIDLKHPINRMDQPSNADTMGDLFASLSGASLALLVGRALNTNIV